MRGIFFKNLYVISILLPSSIGYVHLGHKTLKICKLIIQFSGMCVLVFLSNFCQIKGINLLGGALQKTEEVINLSIFFNIFNEDI